MRVLLLESEPGLAEGVVDQFTSSGHTVSRCHDADQAPFPCHGMEAGHQCPLDDTAIDVAVALDGDAGGTDAPPAGHDGARCALRRAIPLVVVGSKESALAPWATRACDTASPEAVVTAAEEAARAPLARHGEAAREALQSVLEIHGFDASNASAEVSRFEDELRVVLTPGVELDQRAREVVSIRALAGVRAIDPFAARIGVSVD